jgi:hypothetical protein
MALEQGAQFLLSLLDCSSLFCEIAMDRLLTSHKTAEWLGLKATEPALHGLKPVNMGAKINLSFFF